MLESPNALTSADRGSIPGHPSSASVEKITQSVIQSFVNGDRYDEPYRHWNLKNVLPEETLADIAALPFKPIEEANTVGTRESQNAFRSYFGHRERGEFGVADAVATAFQSEEVISTIEKACDLSLDDSYLRVEYALDTDGFWLVPHTDIGVKRFTMLLYLSDGPGHDKLGTDIYYDKDNHFGRSPFVPNMAMIFVPSDKTWHCFEKRPIEGVRRSLIINYVTPEWRAREQLAYPENLIKR